VKEIPLRQSGYRVCVDDEDHECLVALGPWRLNSMGYARRTTDGSLMARHIMGLEREDPRTVDHVDHDPLNNQRSNLRLATRSQNQANRRKQKDHFIGVRPHRRRFQAYIVVSGKQRHIGSFPTSWEAAAARDAMAVKIYGEFASLNSQQAASK
jgi:hypothetical protein